MLNRIDAMKKAFEFFYKTKLYGDYVEFGVFNGKSMFNAINANNIWKKKFNQRRINYFYGFDSFEGLPKSQPKDIMNNYFIFQEGKFKSDFNEQSLKKELTKLTGEKNILLIKSLYEKISKNSEIFKNNFIAGVVHLDCDLPSSSSQALDLITNKVIDGSVILLDDFLLYKGNKNYGQQKAFLDWCNENEIYYQEYFTYSWAGKCFILNKS